MEKHTHKYVRVKIGKNKRILFKCAIEGCVHTCRPELLVGRKSICNRCGDEFVITKELSELAKPHCFDCTKSNRVDEINKIADKLVAILGE